MGVYYTLVNVTKKEQIAFERLPVAKEREIPGNPASAAIVAWYLLKNSGDTIGFFGDEVDSPFPEFSYQDVSCYPDRTDEIIDSLIQLGILVDCGLLYQDEDDPSIFSRDIRNAWMPPALLTPEKDTATQSGGGGGEKLGS